MIKILSQKTTQGNGNNKVAEDQSRNSNIWLTGIPEREQKKKHIERGNCRINNTRKFPRVQVPESLNWEIPLSTRGNWVCQGWRGDVNIFGRGGGEQITVMYILFIDCHKNKNPTRIRRPKLLGKCFSLEFQSQSNSQSGVRAEFLTRKHPTPEPSTYSFLPSDLNMCCSKMKE